MSTDFSVAIGFTGYSQYVVGRPALFDLLFRQIPSDKVHFGKRVVSTSEWDNKVQVNTADGSSYEGDILVGADGAYSIVHQQLYEGLLNEGRLPKSDQEELPFSCICLWVVFTTAQNSVCWMVTHHLDKVTNKTTFDHKQQHRTSENLEWGPHAAKAICDETRGFSLPISDGTLTMGDLYDKTPQDLISKVILEEKVFETWYSGRTVLLGDPCHKLHPSGGRAPRMFNRCFLSIEQNGTQ
ncbi:hypothetical protein BGX23_008187 [Mortierella sp. AD031]|nr:hypothetical protein BGX23_008187 [Mortierella sp. AD031]